MKRHKSLRKKNSQPCRGAWKADEITDPCGDLAISCSCWNFKIRFLKTQSNPLRSIHSPVLPWGKGAPEGLNSSEVTLPAAFWLPPRPAPMRWRPAAPPSPTMCHHSHFAVIQQHPVHGGNGLMRSLVGLKVDKAEAPGPMIVTYHLDRRGERWGGGAPNRGFRYKTMAKVTNNDYLSVDSAPHTGSLHIPPHPQLFHPDLIMLTGGPTLDQAPAEGITCLSCHICQKSPSRQFLTSEPSLPDWGKWE